MALDRSACHTFADHEKNSVQLNPIWLKTPRQRAQIVRRVCERLKDNYGIPRLENPDDPLDDLVFIILSNRTLPEMSNSIYIQLKVRFVDWGNILRVPADELRQILRPAGLSNIKSDQILNILQKIFIDFKEYSLEPLRYFSKDMVEKYLTSLPGVSLKVAKCVMMWTLNYEVLPVDVHVHRIASRLKWTSKKRADQCHAELESLIPPKRRLSFHVDCIAHGRAVCKAIKPACGSCVIYQYCSYQGA